MFPNRVGRMVLDGVVDAADYSKTRWSKNLQDAEAVVDWFYQSCYDAGFDCPLYAAQGPQAIKEVVQDLLQKLYIEPIPAGSDIITSSALKEELFKALYSPLNSFPSLASTISGILTGNYTQILKYMDATEQISCPLNNATQEMRNVSPYSPGGYDFGDDVQTAILCGGT